MLHIYCDFYEKSKFKVWFLSILITLSFDERLIYREVSNIRRTLVGNKIVGLSDVGGASPVGAAPTTSSFST